MACEPLYTRDELIAKLKALDEQMDEAETKSKLGTSQSDHEYSVSIRTLREQYEKYSSMLQRIDPECYRATFGKSVLRFGGSHCL